MCADLLFLFVLTILVIRVVLAVAVGRCSHKISTNEISSLLNSAGITGEEGEQEEEEEQA